MTERTARTRGRPGVGLEAWLVRMIGSGALTSFPLYYPPPAAQGQRPERYARWLLAALRDPENGPRERQRAARRRPRVPGLGRVAAGVPVVDLELS